MLDTLKVIIWPIQVYMESFTAWETRKENLINMGSGNGLLLDGPKPLPEPMLINHHWGIVTFNWGKFHSKCWRFHKSLKISNLRLHLNLWGAYELRNLDHRLCIWPDVIHHCVRTNPLYSTVISINLHYICSPMTQAQSAISTIAWTRWYDCRIKTGSGGVCCHNARGRVRNRKSNPDGVAGGIWCTVRTSPSALWQQTPTDRS